LPYTTKPETSSPNPTLASYLCSTEPSVGVQKDGKMIWIPTPTSVPTFDSTLCIAVKDEWTGFKVSLCWIKEDWSERCGTMTSRECSMT
jgi:hypothetical protein